ncbi:MAG: c-type cytochrome biogenesis protein CcmI [Gammaproteobacteria bacterium]|nr:c-type cytochrome biogenesis protein CcmI [Gammaproteobacteria bacterium]
MTLIFILFVFLIAVIILPSQLSAQTGALDDVKTSLNVRMDQLKKDFQFRTKELSRRLKSADLDEGEWQKLNDELQTETQSSIDTTRIASESDKTSSSWLFALILMIGIIILSFILYQYSGFQEQVEQQIKISKLLKKGTLTIEKLTNKVSSEKSQKALYDLYQALRIRVEFLPTNIEPWRDLASFNADYGRLSEAKAAMKVAMNIEPESLILKIDLAQILLTSENQQDLFRSRRLIQEVLEQQPDNQNALFLLGQNSFQFGMFQRAINNWKQLLNIIKTDSPMATMLQKRIERTEQLIAESKKQTRKAHPKTKTDKPLNTSNTTVATDAKLLVRLSIPEAIRSSLSGKETLYIFAKAVNGPAFPLAAIKTTVENYNKEISLSDSDAMQPQFAISKFEQVKIVARISMKGVPTASKGDIQGESHVIKKLFPESAISVVMDDTVK